MNKPRSSMEKKVSQLPSWLWSNSNVLPSVYKRIWEAVREDRQGANHGETLVDTKKVFPLLLTSQLPTEVLGYIWGLANQKYAGKLTEQELYVVLALVAVAQTSYPFTNLEVLHLLPGPPTPRLNLSLIYPNVPPVQHQQDSGPRYKDSFSFSIFEIARIFILFCILEYEKVVNQFPYRFLIAFTVFLF